MHEIYGIKILVHFSVKIYCSFSDFYSYLFWTDTSTNVIERSNLDGTSRKVISRFSYQSPTHLVIDYKTNKLYSLNLGRDWIMMCDLNGRNKKSVAEILFKTTVFDLIWVRVDLYVEQHNYY